MISEDWRNDAENTALITGIYINTKTVIICNNKKYYFFTVFLIK